MSVILKRCFTFPSAEDRPRYLGWKFFGRYLFLGLDKNRDEHFIYFHVMRSTAVIIALIILVHWVSLLVRTPIDLGIYTIDVDPINYVTSTSYGTMKMAMLFWYPIGCLYVYLLIRINMDSTNCNPLRGSFPVLENHPTPQKEIEKYIIIFLAGSFGSFLLGFGPRYFMVDLHYPNSIPVLFTFSCALWMGYLVTSIMLTEAIVVICLLKNKLKKRDSQWIIPLPSNKYMAS